MQFVCFFAHILELHLLVFDSEWSGREVDDMIVELEEKGSYGSVFFFCLFVFGLAPFVFVVIDDGGESALGQTPDM